MQIKTKFRTSIELAIFRASNDYVPIWCFFQNSTDPFLDRSIDSESSEPKGLCRDSMDSGCSIDSLSDALDGIKRKLIANVFHICEFSISL